jgi:hypothetical protein
MARTLIPAFAFHQNGLEITSTTQGVLCSADGNYLARNDGRNVLVCTNGSGSPVTLSFPIPVTVDSAVMPAKTVVVAAGKTFRIGPFKGDYEQAAGEVFVDSSAQPAGCYLTVLTF